MRAIFVSAFAIGCSLNFATAQTPPAELVEDLSEKAVEYLEDGQLGSRELDRLLEDIDVDGIARFAIGKYTARLSPDEYAAYETTFRSYLRTQMREQLDRFSDGEIEVDDISSRGNQSIIETTVTKPDGETMDVNWRLRRSSDGWEVIDVEAMNLWLAIEQRAQFMAELDASNGDIDALIATLASKS